MNIENRCICGKTFKNDGSWLRHQNSCQAYLQNLSVLASNATKIRPKRRRRDSFDSPSNFSSSSNISIGIPPLAPIEHDLADEDMVVEPPVEPEVHEDQHGRPIRGNRGVLPSRYQDFLPEGPAPFESDEPLHPDPEHPQTNALSEADPSVSLRAPVVHPRMLRTPPNTFGIVREYIGQFPERDPDGELGLEDLIAYNTYTATDALTPIDTENRPPPDDTPNASDSVAPPSQNVQRPYYAPYPNQNVFDLDSWYWGQPQKSQADFLKLTKLINRPTMAQDIEGVNWSSLWHELGSSSSSHFDNRDSWKKGKVSIAVPGTPLPYPVDNIFHKSLTEVIRARFESPRSRSYHYVPHRLIWQCPRSALPEQEIYGELYNSSAWIDEHRRLQELPHCPLPRAIAALMIWSDATHLTDFGSASLWPIYLQFGNESKYTRGQPSKNSFIHLAYIKSLPKSILEFIHLTQGKPASPQLQTHCKRELVHAILRLLLDEEFRDAYAHGIVVMCSDGIKRRLYPRFFIYSADYPEKVLIATIRDMGICPCPRCLVQLKKISCLGMPDDILQRTEHDRVRVDDGLRQNKVKLARQQIYNNGYVVNSVMVDNILKEQSLVPTENAFSSLANLGLDFHQLLQPDLLHEWDLGIIQRGIKHLVRILYAQNKASVSTFDARFNIVPSFGSIRSFSTTVSEFSKFAARNYSDLLVCILPVVEGLLPEPHNAILLDWFFLMNYAYGLAKLRLHTSSTVRLLDFVIVEFGKLSRKFQNITCQAFTTTDLPKEAAKRARMKAKATQKVSEASSTRQPAESTVPPSSAPATQQFSLNNYKFHSAGDLATAIKRYGTLDSYSTQLGEVEHKRSKSGRFDRTSKKDYETQLASMDIRDQRLQNMKDERDLIDDDGSNLQKNPVEAHHFIGSSQKNYVHIGTWLRENGGDQATEDFFARLKDHLLSRLDRNRDTQSTHLYSVAERADLEILNNRMYSHQVFRINYTTYDIRREQDIVKSSGPRRDIMMLSDDESHFLYARVLGIYHVKVLDKRQPGSSPTRMEFLFVRWFRTVQDSECGWKGLRLPQVAFIPQTEQAFGFVNPESVIRGAHLLPAFAHGRTALLLGYSKIARGPLEFNDFRVFYVNWFADRDMLMRNLGGGVGHINMPHCDAESLYPPVHTEVDSDETQANTINTEMEDGEGGNMDDEDEDEIDTVLESYSTL